MSKLFTGCISDKELVRQSGFLDELEEGDVVMADKGFNIQDLLAIHGSKLIAPPIMTKNTVSARAPTATRRVANARVHVERIIRTEMLCHFKRGYSTNLQVIYNINCKGLCRYC